MSFTTRIKSLNNNKKKKNFKMTQLKASQAATNPSNDENPNDDSDADKYVDVDGIKFKITESEEDEGEVDGNENENGRGHVNSNGDPNEDATSTTSSSHELQKVKKRKPNQEVKRKTTLKTKEEQKQQEKLDKSKSDMMLKINKRKVALAKFEPNASLYPVCRSWMVNEQESKYIDLDYLFTQYVKRPENGLKLLKALIDDEISCVSLMPAPVSKEIEIDGTPKSRIPTAMTLAGCDQEQVDKSVLDDIIKRLEENNTEDCPSTVGLLREHLQRWKRVKVNWKKHTRAYDEERYGVNFAILDTMLKL